MAKKGILGTKLGMTQIFDKNHKVVPVTVIKAGPNIINSIRTISRDGYSAIQLAYEKINQLKINKPTAGQYNTSGIVPHKYLVEIRLDNIPNRYKVGQEITAEIFSSNTHVDVTSISKGKGFSGTMKRHKFSGQGASHGVQAVHRRPGSIGGCSTPGRVFKGTKMSGRMGYKQVTIQNLKIYKVDTSSNFLLLKGSVPGNNGSLVIVRSAIKRGCR